MHRPSLRTHPSRRDTPTSHHAAGRITIIDVTMKHAQREACRSISLEHQSLLRPEPHVRSYAGQRPGTPPVLGIHPQTHSLIHGSRPGTSSHSSPAVCMITPVASVSACMHTHHAQLLQPHRPACIICSSHAGTGAACIVRSSHAGTGAACTPPDLTVFQSASYIHSGSVVLLGPRPLKRRTVCRFTGQGSSPPL